MNVALVGVFGSELGASLGEALEVLPTPGLLSPRDVPRGSISGPFTRLLAPLEAFREPGRFGIPVLASTGADQTFSEGQVVKEPRSRSWLEVVPFPGENPEWLALSPQNSSSELQYQAYQSVAVSGDVVLLATVDVQRGLAESRISNEPPREECFPGFAGHGDDIHYVCIQGSCPKGCQGIWQMRRRKNRLVGCEC